MNWRRKARVQQLIARLPSELSYRTYYWIQRHFGALRSPTPASRLSAGIKIAEKLMAHNKPLLGHTYLEVGTGRSLSLPIGLWLCGASAGYSVDLNPYLKSELVLADVRYLITHGDDIVATLPDGIDSTVFGRRLHDLTVCPLQLQAILDLLQLTYLAPADATAIDLPSHSIDLHLSFAVFEHIQAVTARDILLEGRRLLKPNGLFVHGIDFSDHFSHSDKSISSIHFLQFSDEDWQKIAGNRYMFHNRLRIDEFIEIFSEYSQVVESAPELDPRAYDELCHGFPLAQGFLGRTHAYSPLVVLGLSRPPRFDFKNE